MTHYSHLLTPNSHPSPPTPQIQHSLSSLKLPAAPTLRATHFCHPRCTGFFLGTLHFPLAQTALLHTLTLLFTRQAQRQQALPLRLLPLHW